MEDSKAIEIILDYVVETCIEEARKRKMLTSDKRKRLRAITPDNYVKYKTAYLERYGICKDNIDIANYQAVWNATSDALELMREDGVPISAAQRMLHSIKKSAGHI